MRRSISLALASLALAGALPLAAQAQVAPPPAIAAGNTLLTVSAEGRAARAPDLAVFTAGVATAGKTAGEAMAANSASMSRVVAALKRAGIADRDIQTSNLNLHPVYAPQQPQRPDGAMIEPRQPEIIGYQANNTVTVRQRNLAEFGKVIDTLVTAGANQVNGPDFQVDKPDEALDAARIEAIGKARARAELYARAAGLKVVRIVAISESGGYAPPPMPMYRMAVNADMAGAPPVASGEVSLAANVSVQFELGR